jgi:DNA (cytosine-5)-methyltransferase 1
MKILNLYAGIGGNRVKWGGVSVTAVEMEENIAAVYAANFPEDTVVIGDAHEFLRLNFKDFDFIWSSPPCQTHSAMAKATRHDLNNYPDMALYQEIIFLQNYFKGRFVVENVVPYYKPLIRPSVQMGRHLFWTNFDILPVKLKSFPNMITAATAAEAEKMKQWLGIKYDGNLYYKDQHDPCKVLRNCVHPDLGLHILNESKRNGLF